MSRLGGILGAGGSVGRILLGTAVGQGVLILASPVLTRIYSAADFGLLAIVTAVASVLGGFASLAFEAAVPIAGAESEARSLILLGLTATISISGLIAIGAFFLRGQFAIWFGSDTLESAWWLIPTTVAAVGLFNVLSSWLIRERRHGMLGVRNATQGVVQVLWAVSIGLAVPKLGIGLASSLSAGRIAGALTAGTQSLRSLSGGSRPTTNELRETAARYRRFPLVLSWSRLLNGLGLQAPALLIGWWFGALELGLFALTLRVIAGPIGMIADAAAQYFEGAFASRLATGVGLRPLVINLSLTLFAIGLAPMAVVWAAAPTLYAFVFGPEWTAAGELARILAVMFVFQLAVSPVSRALPLLQRQGTQVVWDLARLTLVAASIVVPAMMGATLSVAVAVMAIAQCVSYGALLGLVLSAAGHRGGGSD